MSRPRVVVHQAVSLDGCVEGFAPEVKVFYDLARRFHEDATLTGSETVLAANAPDENPDSPIPKAPEGDHRPLLAIVDGRGRVQSWGTMLASPYWRAGIALCTRKTPDEYRARLDRRGVMTVVAGEHDKVDLKAALQALQQMFHVGTVRVDSGGALSGAMLRQGLVDEVSLLVHPLLVGHDARTFFRETSGNSLHLQLRKTEKLAGDLLWLRYTVTQSAPLL